MDFNLEDAIEILGRTPALLRGMLDGAPEVWIRGNEGENTFAPFDVVGHLIHGDRTDWIPRARIILSDQQNKTFVPFDRFAQFDRSAENSLSQLLDEFQSLRQENLETLRGFHLAAADLQREGVHPSLGKVTLAQLLSTWVVHDLDHLGQVVRVMAKQYSKAVGPWSAYLSILSWKTGK